MTSEALSTVAGTLQQPKCLHLDEWIKKSHTHTYTMKYYLALKRRKILPFVRAWMDPDRIMLSEIRHTEKDNYCMPSLIREI